MGPAIDPYSCLKKDYIINLTDPTINLIHKEACNYKNKTQGLQLHTVSDSNINPLINTVNTRGNCSDKT